jgi:branched-chain amino acid transport system permease protein
MGIIEDVSVIMISSLAIGSIYALMALGLSMLWSTLNLINFAHGSLMMLGAYIFVYILMSTNNLLLALLAIPIMFLIGMATYKTVFEKTSRMEDFLLRNALITLVLGAMIEQLINIYFGGTYMKIPEFVSGYIFIGSLRIASQYIAITFISLGLLFLLYLIIFHTKYGLAIRAVGQDLQESLLCGLNIRNIYSVTVGIGFVLASIAGILLGSIYIFNPVSGRIPLLISYIIVIFGGVGSFIGTLVASYIIALLYVSSSYYIGGSWSLFIAYLMMLLILTIRPYGIFGGRR